MAQRDVTITPVNPGGAGVVFGLAGDAKLSRWGMGSTGEGGWQIVDRPRQGATTEWVDYSPYQMDLSLIINGFSDVPGGSPQSIENACNAVASWELPALGTSPPEPAKLQVAGPVPGTDLTWVVYITNWKNAYRDGITGERLYQELEMTLWEYNPPTVVVTAASPAAQQRAITGLPSQTPESANAAQINSNGGAVAVITSGGGAPVAVQYSTSKYTVRQGDTLLTIAATQLGDASDWVLIAQVNGIRDPRNIKVGQVLIMPFVSGRNQKYPTYGPVPLGPSRAAGPVINKNGGVGPTTPGSHYGPNPT